jgi:hypothetical protein
MRGIVSTPSSREKHYQNMFLLASLMTGLAMCSASLLSQTFPLLNVSSSPRPENRFPIMEQSAYRTPLRTIAFLPVSSYHLLCLPKPAPACSFFVQLFLPHLLIQPPQSEHYNKYHFTLRKGQKMAFPAKWPTFRKRYLDLDRHDNYQDALAEVSAGWTETKRLRALHDPPRTFNADWRQQAAAHMQTVKDNDIARRAALDAAEAARIAAVDAPGLAMLGAAADAIAADDATTDMLLGHDIDVGVMAAGPTPAEDANAFWRGGWCVLTSFLLLLKLHS